MPGGFVVQDDARCKIVGYGSISGSQPVGIPAGAGQETQNELNVQRKFPLAQHQGDFLHPCQQAVWAAGGFSSAVRPAAHSSRLALLFSDLMR